MDDDYGPSTPGWGVTHFDQVQSGIDAVAASGLVHVQAGLYAENVLIDKTIELAGEAQGTTIIGALIYYVGAIMSGVGAIQLRGK